MDETSKKRYGRLMLLMPPGSAKSTYASVVFPSYYLGEEGRRRLILTSYGADLARKMGRRTRSIIRQARYKRIFDATLSDESSAAEQFLLTNGSEYMASGLLGGITGNRADGAIVDDPVSGREDAESETMRQKTWDAYHDDLLYRLVPGGWLVLIMTRWNADDIAGRILPEEWNGESGEFDCRDGRRWRVLSLQAKCETTTDPLNRKLGEYLWPQWFDREYWIEAERNPRTWNSLFQQRPRPTEGAYFTTDMFLVDGQPIESPANGGTWRRFDVVFAVIDSALKDNTEHDGVAVTYFAFSRHKQTPKPLLILDWEIHHIKAADLEEWLPNVYARLEQLAEEWQILFRSLGAFIEDKVSGTMLLQQASRRGLRAHPIDSKLTALGKKVRAVNISGYIQGGQVKISRAAYEKRMPFKNATRNHLLSQALAFEPSSKDQGQDDLLDTLSYGCALSLGNAKGF